MDICRKITGLDRLTGATLVHTNCADLKIVFVTDEIVRVRASFDKELFYFQFLYLQNQINNPCKIDHLSRTS